MGIIIYQLFLWLYQAGVFLIAPWNQKALLWRKGRGHILERVRQAMLDRSPNIIWVHCASLGEFEQARPLVERIKNQYPHYHILITFFSPSGYEVRKNYQYADYLFYLPMDGQANAKKFLDIVQPRFVLWIKYEYWYFYLQEIKKHNIPLMLVSGVFRENQPFFKWYGQLHRKMLSCFTQFFVQNEESKKLLGRLGYSENVIVSGDTRFDRVIEIAEHVQPIAEIESFINGASVIVAGSTWEEDEEEMDHFANTHPEVKFIIAPHEIEEEHLEDIEKLFHRTIRYSRLLTHLPFSGPGNPPSAEKENLPVPNVLIVDNVGMLACLYKYADIAYVGGGFGDDGVHNVLEAAVYGKPVVFGPVYEKYQEAVDLVESEAAFPIENALELENIFTLLLEKTLKYTRACQASKEYVYSNRGATEKILKSIQEKRLLTS